MRPSTKKKKKPVKRVVTTRGPLEDCVEQHIGPSDKEFDEIIVKHSVEIGQVEEQANLFLRSLAQFKGHQPLTVALCLSIVDKVKAILSGVMALVKHRDHEKKVCVGLGMPEDGKVIDFVQELHALANTIRLPVVDTDKAAADKMRASSWTQMFKFCQELGMHTEEHEGVDYGDCFEFVKSLYNRQPERLALINVARAVCVRIIDMTTDGKFDLSKAVAGILQKFDHEDFKCQAAEVACRYRVESNYELRKSVDEVIDDLDGSISKVESQVIRTQSAATEVTAAANSLNSGASFVKSFFAAIAGIGLAGLLINVVQSLSL